MNRERVITFLGRPAPSSELDVFCKYMRPRQHSREEVLSLWETFFTGYCAAVDELKHREDLLQSKALVLLQEIAAKEQRIRALFDSAPNPIDVSSFPK